MKKPKISCYWPIGKSLNGLMLLRQRCNLGKALLILAAIVSLILVHCNHSEILWEPHGGYVKGIVSEKGPEDPIDSVNLTLSPDSLHITGLSTFSDTLGGFLVSSGFNTGRMYLFASKNGYRDTIGVVIVIKLDTVTLDLQMEEQ